MEEEEKQKLKEITQEKETSLTNLELVSHIRIIQLDHQTNRNISNY